jgi:hypothetical protein
MVSAGFFEIFGVHPVIGQTFRKQDDRLGAAPVAMISEGLWKQKFGSARNIVGQRITVDGIGRFPGGRPTSSGNRIPWDKLFIRVKPAVVHSAAAFR